MLERIAVIGLGYVGLPLAINASENGYEVLGVDKNLAIVDSINSGISTTEDIENSRVNAQVKSLKLFATSSYEVIENCSIVIICVPTPLQADTSPDLSILASAAKSLSPYIKPGTLVILESTVSTGTTRDFLLPIIQKNSSVKANEFDLAFSPERIDPSNSTWNIGNTPKIVAGLNDKSKTRAIEFYSKFISTIVSCESLEVAETAKLLENSFRLVNISFINELAIFCRAVGLDINQVIAAASTKPYGFMPFYPSLGAGGHCIPVDPMYLVSKANEVNAPLSIIELAAKINRDNPIHFVNEAKKVLGTLSRKRILVIGIAYKPNVADTRESPAEILIEQLRIHGAYVEWHDEIVGSWRGELSKEITTDYDLTILATAHDYLDLNKVKDLKVLDTNGKSFE